MECYHCGQENNDSAVYCKYCGKRIDGKIKCPNCEEMIDCDSQFCEHCGQLISLEDDYIDDTPDETLTADEIPTRNYRTEKFNFTIFTLMATFFSLLFTFFIGINHSMNISASTSGSSLMSSSYNTNLYYFFGDCYDQIAALEDLELSLPDFTMSHLYFFAIFGTIISLAIMLVVVIFAIITLVRYIKYVKGKSEKSYFPYALATYFSYITGLTLFYALYGDSFQSILGAVSSRINFYSMLGVILSTICIIPAIISKVKENIRNSQNSLSRIPYAFLSAIMLLVVIVLTATPSITVQSKNDGAMSLNYFSAMTFIATIFAFKKPTYSPITGELVKAQPPTELYGNLLITLFLQIAILIACIIVLAKFIKSISGNNKKHLYTELISSIVLSVVSIVYMSLIISTQESFINYVDSDAEISKGLALPIMIVIFSLLYLTVSICNVVSIKRMQRQDY